MCCLCLLQHRISKQNQWFSFAAVWSCLEGNMPGQDFSSWLSHEKLLQVKQSACLKCSFAFLCFIWLPAHSLSTFLHWCSLCGLQWKGPFLVPSRTSWGCCIFWLSLFVAWPAFPCLYNNICSADFKYPWLHLASIRHLFNLLVCSWECICSQKSGHRNQLYFCPSPLSHANLSISS